MSVVQDLRMIMKSRECKAYLLPRTDQFQSEYLSQNDQAITHITGFTGSNAIAFISQTEALLWTDGRYYLQAQKELKQGWQMKKMEAGKSQLLGQKKWFEYVKQNYAKVDIEVDDQLISIQSFDDGNKYFKQNANQLKFIPQKEDYINLIWKNRPKQIFRDWFMHQEWVSQKARQKLEWICKSIKEKKSQRMMLVSLSEICWTLNIRSSQIPYQPFLKAYFYYEFGQQNKGILFINDEHHNFTQLDKDVKQHFRSLGINLEKKSKMSQILNQIQEPVCICKKKANVKLFNSLKKPVQWSGVQLKKSIKKQKQIRGFQQSHIRDALALNKYFAFLNKRLDNGQEIGEFDACHLLLQCRKEMEHFKGESFSTISCTGPNSAIIHYNPSKSQQAIIKKSQIYLCDSGGHYLDGTTDVTRTFHFGQPSSEKKQSFTRVLLGNLDIFPKNSKITGSDIDVLARRRLWQKGLDYKHGTGHGIGYFGDLNQSPVGIQKNVDVAFQVGMMVTNGKFYQQNLATQRLCIWDSN